MKHEVYIVSISSNTDAKANIEKVKQLFKQDFVDVEFASLLSTFPIGDGYPDRGYKNTAVKFISLLDQSTLVAKLKDMEAALGRTPELKLKKIVPIDLDIICHNGKVIHKDYERFDFTHRLVDELLK